MVRLLNRGRPTPIGLDIGSRSVKLLQLAADRTRLVDAARCEMPAGASDLTPAQRNDRIAQALRQARQGRQFRGKEAVLCLGAGDLFVQNVRVTKTAGADLEKVATQEVSGRLPFPISEAELRFVEAGDVRQGDSVRREVIVLACHRPKLDDLLNVTESAGLRPIAVDVEPAALLRCYVRQFRRDEDRTQRAMFVHLGAASTAVVIAQGANPLFIKYLDLGGQHLDEAVARHLEMDVADAAALRRQSGDRRTDQQDPEISRSMGEAIRPVVERLANELSLCVRYHSVTFRGQPVARAVIGGGEANAALVALLATRLDVACELGDPLRMFEATASAGRKCQWDVAAGLALREVEP